MPRGKLNESYVKQTAVKWLHDHYNNSLDAQTIVSGMEAWVRKNRPEGTGRADGLIAAKLKNGNLYTISIEAKSSRTWSDIIVQEDVFTMLFRAIIFALVITTLFIVLGFTSLQMPLQGIILPIVALTAIGFCIIYFSPLGDHYRIAKVIDQAVGYPGNEKWIALSTDIYNRLSRENQSLYFERICQRKGIGLIRVTSGVKSFVIVHPKPIPTPKNLDSFLSCYSRDEAVRNLIEQSLRKPEIAEKPLLLDEPERSKIELSPAEIEESISNNEFNESDIQP